MLTEEPQPRLLARTLSSMRAKKYVNAATVKAFFTQGGSTSETHIECSCVAHSVIFGNVIAWKWLHLHPALPVKSWAGDVWSGWLFLFNSTYCYITREKGLAHTSLKNYWSEIKLMISGQKLEQLFLFLYQVYKSISTLKVMKSFWKIPNEIFSQVIQQNTFTKAWKSHFYCVNMTKW